MCDKELTPTIFLNFTKEITVKMKGRRQWKEKGWKNAICNVRCKFPFIFLLGHLNTDINHTENRHIAQSHTITSEIHALYVTFTKKS